MTSFFRFNMIFVFILLYLNGSFLFRAENIVELQITEVSGSAQQNVAVTFGHVFRKGEIPSGTHLGAQWSDGTNVSVQLDQSSLHPDGSLRHAVITTIIPELEENETKSLLFITSGSPLTGNPVTASRVLQTDYDVMVALNIGGTLYSSSARNLLQIDSSKTWLSGPLVTEWLVSSPVKDGNGNPHPHLTARFFIRAYSGNLSIRTDVIIENNWSFEQNPQNFNYDVSVTIPGKGTVLAQNSVTHYRQARWRRIFWWGVEPQIHIKHDAIYLMKTGSVPTYDTTLVVPDIRFEEMVTRFEQGSALMQIGYMEAYMPAAGGREDIAPLPRWAARYIISQDARAKKVMLGLGEQAGSWSIHYRDKNTDLPISLDDYPNLTIEGETPSFPPCGGDCSTPYVPDMSHQPSLSYVPYLVTGDHFHLEELHFWANWNLFYGPPRGHGFSEGLVTWDQTRGQAWGLRTLGHAAYITPDNHPLKSYFLEKLENNITFYNDNWLDWNPLGYISSYGTIIEPRIATWQDDFLTWTFGHLVSLEFSSALKFAKYKAKFPVGRIYSPDMCWILASTYWPVIFTPYPLTDVSRPCTTWVEYHESIIKSWDNNAFGGMTSDISGREDELINAPCNSALMAEILGLEVGEMIGYAWSPEGYPSNLQPALAVAVEVGTENAVDAWTIFDNRAVKPWWLAGEGGGYDDHPQWAIVPGKIGPLVGIKEQKSTFSERDDLFQVFPNPFNASTKISFHLKKTSQVTVIVYNILGQTVETLANKTFPSGINHIIWKPNNISGGLYLLDFVKENVNTTVKVLYLK